MCGGVQKSSRPMDRCQEMSQCAPRMTEGYRSHTTPDGPRDGGGFLARDGPIRADSNGFRAHVAIITRSTRHCGEGRQKCKFRLAVYFYILQASENECKIPSIGGFHVTH